MTDTGHLSLECSGSCVAERQEKKECSIIPAAVVVVRVGGKGGVGALVFTEKKLEEKDNGKLDDGKA